MFYLPTNYHLWEDSKCRLGKLSMMNHNESATYSLLRLTCSFMMMGGKKEMTRTDINTNSMYNYLYYQPNLDYTCNVTQNPEL